MKFFSLLVTTIILLFSCKNRNTSAIKDSGITEVKKDLIKSTQDSTSDALSKKDFKVSAYLIYVDGTQSSFDVLNNKTIALWNVIAGGGDAIKPSEKTKISLTGDLKNLDIKIKNGRKVVIDTTITSLVRAVDYTINNTGCQEVFVAVQKNKKLLYNDTIPFQCGE